MVGVTHFVSLSSPLWDLPNTGICCRRTARIASGELQDWRLGRSGCEARSSLVLRLYVSSAALKMDAKLEREVDVEGTVDMMIRGEVIQRANDRPSISRRPGRFHVW